MKAILTLTALLTASPALASDELIQSYKQIAVGILQVHDCGIKMDERRVRYLASLPSQYGEKSQDVTMAAVGGMVFAYREMLNASGAMGEFCKAAYMER